jgi:hypothetical protein
MGYWDLVFYFLSKNKKIIHRFIELASISLYVLCGSCNNSSLHCNFLYTYAASFFALILHVVSTSSALANTIPN